MATIEKNGSTILNSFVWRFLERFGANIVSLIVSILLARILDPTSYGIVALITSITTILQIFIDGGFGNSLIQKKDSDELDFSTTFYFSQALSLLLYFTLFLCAPLIASFFNKFDSKLLIDLIRVASIPILIAPIKNILQAKIAKNMQFKKFFFATLAGTICAAIVGIFMAFKNFGPWALVAQNIVNITVDTLVLLLVVKWKPQLRFSFKRLSVLFRFGSKLLATNLIRASYSELRSFAIGKRYTSEDLAFYNKGMLFPKTIVGNIDSAIDSVLLPSMSKEQDDIFAIKKIVRGTIKASTFLIFPMMIGLSVCSKSIVSILLTDKWLGAVPFIYIFSIALAFHPIHTSNLNAFMALGKSGLCFKLELIKKSIGICILLVSMWFGPLYIALGFLVSNLIEQIINSFPSKKIINYSFFEQLKDLLPNLVCSVIMGAIVYIVGIDSPNNVLTLVKQITIGISAYALLTALFNKKTAIYCWNILKKSFRKN